MPRHGRNEIHTWCAIPAASSPRAPHPPETCVARWRTASRNRRVVPHKTQVQADSSCGESRACDAEILRPRQKEWRDKLASTTLATPPLLLALGPRKKWTRHKWSVERSWKRGDLTSLCLEMAGRPALRLRTIVRGEGAA